jgi:predicted glycoside hydrolase/deacetylase ChbG (UPF0249 family)
VSIGEREKNLIVNADDFGASPGLNRAVIDCHTGGIVTSASLMVTGPAAAEAIERAAEYPALSIGLHWDVSGEGQREFDMSDPSAVREEFSRQLDAFQNLVGAPPTHVDSHQHVHTWQLPLFRDLVEPLGVPLRCDGRVAHIGGFYGQWEHGVTDLEHVSVPFLEQLLREEVGAGWTELSCHPGYVSPDFSSVYDREREVEVRTLTDRRIRAAIERLGIRLASYKDYALEPALEPT